MNVSEESAAPSGEPIRCQLIPNPSPGRPLPPSLAIDVGKDSIRVIDASTNARITSARLAQVTTTPENYTYGGFPSRAGAGRMTAVLVVRVPGLHPLTIQPREVDRSIFSTLTRLGQSRLSWRGNVPGIFEGAGRSVEARRPAYTVTDAEWLTLAEKFGLGSLVEESGGTGGIRYEWVIVLAFVALTIGLMLWAISH